MNQLGRSIIVYKAQARDIGTCNVAGCRLNWTPKTNRVRDHVYAIEFGSLQVRVCRMHLTELVRSLQNQSETPQ